jgi:hypothetical protein
MLLPLRLLRNYLPPLSQHVRVYMIFHSSSAEPEKPIPPSARDHSPSPNRSSVPPQTPTKQQDDSRVPHSRSEEPERISPPTPLETGVEEEEEEEIGDRQGQPQQEEDMVTLLVVAKNSCDTRRWPSAKEAQAPSLAETQPRI